MYVGLVHPCVPVHRLSASGTCNNICYKIVTSCYNLAARLLGCSLDAVERRRLNHRSRATAIDPPEAPKAVSVEIRPLRPRNPGRKFGKRPLEGLGGAFLALPRRALAWLPAAQVSPVHAPAACARSNSRPRAACNAGPHVVEPVRAQRMPAFLRCATHAACAEATCALLLRDLSLREL